MSTFPKSLLSQLAQTEFEKVTGNKTQYQEQIDFRNAIQRLPRHGYARSLPCHFFRRSLQYHQHRLCHQSAKLFPERQHNNSSDQFIPKFPSRHLVLQPRC